MDANADTISRGGMHIGPPHQGDPETPGGKQGQSLPLPFQTLMNVQRNQNTFLYPSPVPQMLRSAVQIVQTPPPPPQFPPLPQGGWDRPHTPQRGRNLRIDSCYTRSPGDYDFVRNTLTPSQRWKSSPGPDQLEKRRVFEKELGKRAYYFRGRNNVLSNFFQFNLKIFYREFSSTEAAYQYCKAVTSECWDVAEELVRSNSGLAAKGIAHKVPLSNRWDNLKEEAMKVILEAKLEQCEHFHRFLLDHKFSFLVEDTDNAFWARGSDYKGKNVLGHMIMDLREKLVKGECDADNMRKNLKEFMKRIPKWPEDQTAARRQSWSHSNVSSNNSNLSSSMYYSPQLTRQPYYPRDSASDRRGKRDYPERHDESDHTDRKRKRRRDSEDESGILTKSVKKEREEQDATKDVSETKASLKTSVKIEDDIKMKKVADNLPSMKRDRESDVELSIKTGKDDDRRNSSKTENALDVIDKIKSEKDYDVEDSSRRPLEDVQNNVSEQRREESSKKLKMLRSEWRKEEAEEVKHIVGLQCNTKKVDDRNWCKSDPITEIRTISIKKKQETSSSSDSSRDSPEWEPERGLKEKSRTSPPKPKCSSSHKRKRRSSNTSLSTLSSRSSQQKSKRKKSKLRTASISSPVKENVMSKKGKKDKSEDSKHDSKKKKRRHISSGSSSDDSHREKSSKKKNNRKVYKSSACDSNSENERYEKKKEKVGERNVTKIDRSSEKREIRKESITDDAKRNGPSISSPEIGVEQNVKQSSKIGKKFKKDKLHDATITSDRRSSSVEQLHDGKKKKKEDRECRSFSAHDSEFEKLQDKEMQNSPAERKDGQSNKETAHTTSHERKKSKEKSAHDAHHRKSNKKQELQMSDKEHSPESTSIAERSSKRKSKGNKSSVAYEKDVSFERDRRHSHDKNSPKNSNDQDIDSRSDSAKCSDRTKSELTRDKPHFDKNVRSIQTESGKSGRQLTNSEKDEPAEFGRSKKSRCKSSPDDESSAAGKITRSKIQQKQKAEMDCCACYKCACGCHQKTSH